MNYTINKGVNRPLDFYGLKEQYIIYFVLGIAMSIMVYFFVSLVHQYLAIGLALSIAIADYIGCYHLNNRYGVNGLAKKEAGKGCPERIKMKRIKGRPSFEANE